MSTTSVPRGPRARVLGGAIASLSLVATLCLVSASPASAGTGTFTGDTTSGNVTVHAGSNPEVFQNPTSHLALSWTDPSAAAPLNGTLTMDPLYTAPFLGPFDLTFYVEAKLTTTSPISGSLNTSTGALSLHTPTDLAVTVYTMQGATPSPSTDDKITGPGCHVPVTIDWTGTMTATSVHVTSPQFTIPTFPSGDSGCGAATGDLNAGIAGTNNTVDLTYGGTRSVASGALLRVTTNPALPGDIIVDGIARDAYGINWAELPAGSHQVCFGDVLGFAKPGCQTVSLTDGNTTTVQGNYTQNGYLRVMTSPALSSTITVDGVARNDWGLWAEVAPGSHNVCWGTIAGYNAPACANFNVVAGQTTTATGTFTVNAAATGPDPSTFGYLRATTNPASPAMISVDGNWANNWGLDWVKLPIGSHQVCFGPSNDRIAPASCSNVSIAAGQTAVISGDYQVEGFLRVLTNPSVQANIYVDGVVANAYGMWAAKPAGTYDVCFGPAVGKVTPPCQNDVVVTAGQTTTLTGTYVASP